jgi:hypothetical protein
MLGRLAPLLRQGLLRGGLAAGVPQPRPLVAAPPLSLSTERTQTTTRVAPCAGAAATPLKQLPNAALRSFPAGSPMRHKVTDRIAEHWQRCAHLARRPQPLQTRGLQYPSGHRFPQYQGWDGGGPAPSKLGLILRPVLFTGAVVVGGFGLAAIYKDEQRRKQGWTWPGRQVPLRAGRETLYRCEGSKLTSRPSRPQTPGLPSSLLSLARKTAAAAGHRD